MGSCLSKEEDEINAISKNMAIGSGADEITNEMLDLTLGGAN